jgi:hypothetical protein
MNNQELFELRKTGVLRFQNPSELSTFLDRLIVDKTTLPLVEGYEDGDINSWKVRNLTPETEEDELTLRNYTAGLKMLCRYWTETQREHLLIPHFSGILTYNGIQEDNKHNQRVGILGVSVGWVNSARNIELISFGIHLYNRGPNYYAKSEVNESGLVRIMRQYKGPN